MVFRLLKNAMPIQSRSSNRDAPKMPLRPGDSIDCTVGCRRAEPLYCKQIDLPAVCAWVREDGMCYLPPKGWEARFRLLEERAPKEAVRNGEPGQGGYA
jgi:hypothetical protein